MDIKPQAMALPKDTSTLPQGKYGPIFPKTPACYRIAPACWLSRTRNSGILLTS